jgi:hypothetical protein
MVYLSIQTFTNMTQQLIHLRAFQHYLEQEGPIQ